MRACAVRSGQLLNKTDVSKDVGISAKTVNEWLSILEASNQITLLEPYYTNLGKRLVKSPKIFFNDVGMLCFLLGLTPSTLAESYVVGSVWETFLYGEIRKIMRVKHPEGSIWFYRDQSHEVDFVIEKGRVVTLLDGKWKEYPEAKDFNTMLKVKKFFPRVAENTMILCRTPHSYPIGKEMVAVNGFSIEAIL
jgi:hypothetical protein